MRRPHLQQLELHGHLTPSAALAYNTTYTATVSGAKDSAGDPMSGAVLLVVHHRPRGAADGHQ